ncbi:MAG TPA: diguanylate cyclase [Polyangiaceae bacterium]|nr:diguanylate cyclase [Polyangiaceae bacterium]
MSRTAPAQPKGHRFGLRAQLLVAVSVTCFCIVAGAAALQFMFSANQRRAEWVWHSQEVIAASQRLGRTASDAQTGMRGYLLTKRLAFLAPYYRGVDVLTSGFPELARSVSDNAPQVQLVHKMQQAFEHWNVEVAQRWLNQASSLDAEQSEQTLQRGDRYMNELRDTLEQFVAAEENLLEQRRTSSNVASRWSALAATAGFGLALLVVAVAGMGVVVRVRRSVRELEQAAEAVARGELSRRAPQTGHDELASLSLAFNEMAGRLDQREKEENALKKLRDMMQSSHSSEEAISLLARLGPACLPARSAQLFVMSFSKNLLDPAVSWGTEHESFNAFAPEDCWALRSGRVHCVHDPSDLACAHQTERAGMRACLPLVAQGETVGLLYVAPHGPELTAVAQEIAGVLALALANLRLREVLRNQAIRDPLTGLFNRRYLEETFERELARAKRTNVPISIAVLDLDHFKRFNDTHGHAGGDALLRAFGAALRTMFRADDVLCRFGGEEFVVILPSCTLHDAIARVDAFRASMASLEVQSEGRSLGEVTVSAGIANFPAHGDDRDKLFRLADRALYRAKRAGRNRIEVVESFSAELGHAPGESGSMGDQLWSEWQSRAKSGN